jgi:hypothetical protein
MSKGGTITRRKKSVQSVDDHAKIEYSWTEEHDLILLDTKLITQSRQADKY